MKSRPHQIPATVAVAFTFAWLTSSVVASPPYVNYQGTINDASGAPIHNPSQALEFNIYDAPTGGVKVWGPFNLTAPVLNGRFNVILGPEDTDERSLDTVFSGSNDRYLEIRVGTTTIAPRQRFLANPYSYSASSVNNGLVQIDPGEVSVKGFTQIRFGKDWPLNAAGNATIGLDSLIAGQGLAIFGGGPNATSQRTTVYGQLFVSPWATPAGLTVSGNTTIGGTLKTPTLIAADDRQIATTRLVDMSDILGGDSTPRVINLNSPNSQILTNNTYEFVNLAPYLDDDDGCRIRVFIQYETHSQDYVRGYEIVLFAERADFGNANKVGIRGQTIQLGGEGGEGARNWNLDANTKENLFGSHNNDVRITNFRHALIGGNEQVSSGYNVWFWTQDKDASARFIIYDR